MFHQLLKGMVMHLVFWVKLLLKKCRLLANKKPLSQLFGFFRYRKFRCMFSSSPRLYWFKVIYEIFRRKAIDWHWAKSNYLTNNAYINSIVGSQVLWHARLLSGTGWFYPDSAVLFIWQYHLKLSRSRIHKNQHVQRSPLILWTYWQQYWTTIWFFQISYDLTLFWSCL